MKNIEIGLIKWQKPFYKVNDWKKKNLAILSAMKKCRSMDLIRTM